MEKKRKACRRKQHGAAMLLNVSLSNTNNHGEKQAPASNVVASTHQRESDAHSLQSVKGTG